MDNCAYLPETPSHRDSLVFGPEISSHDRFFSRERMERTVQNIKPNSTYSIRARYLAELRERIASVNDNPRDDFTVPTEQCVEAARTFINGLVDGVVAIGCRMAIASDGEINFFFERKNDLFQILIGADGRLSYYGKNADGEMLGDGIAAERFPHLQLLSFLGG